MKKKSGVKSPLRVGAKVLIRTVTLYYTGRIVSFDDHEILLEDAAWIADTGRFSEACKTGSVLEVEPYFTPVLVGRGAVVDMSEWTNALPREVK